MTDLEREVVAPGVALDAPVIEASEPANLVEKTAMPAVPVDQQAPLAPEDVPTQLMPVVDAETVRLTAVPTTPAVPASRAPAAATPLLDDPEVRALRTDARVTPGLNNWVIAIVAAVVVLVAVAAIVSHL